MISEPRKDEGLLQTQTVKACSKPQRGRGEEPREVEIYRASAG